eukprot:1562252-Pyramimonas_sp.AAC.1
MGLEHWRQTCRRLTSWLHKSVHEAKKRSLVITGQDSNCGFGLRRTGHAIATPTGDQQHLGPVRAPSRARSHWRCGGS